VGSRIAIRLLVTKHVAAQLCDGRFLDWSDLNGTGLSAYDAPAYNNGTKESQFMFAANVIWFV
jgi:hypothetical protein